MLGWLARPFGSGGDQLPECPVVSGALCGDVDLDLGRAASVGEARIPAAEAAGQVIVGDSGAGPG